ncbi:MAG: ABC transporter ATP-binding protein [Microvirga sp.]|jgi:urea ABC transporter ATP-binding protein UrtE
MKPILSTSGLRSGYGTGDVLQDISIEVNPGEIVGVLGRNGMGKSTLMRTAIGLLPARAGSLVFEGVDITREGADARARRGIGYVPQGREIFPHLTVLENLQMGRLVNAGRGRYALEEVYAWFPFLRERERQRGGTLSGGQQEMLAIARALVNGPSLLLLDEPSDGVQPSIVQEIGAFIVDLVARRAITVLLVEQNVDLIQTAVHRAYVLEKGRVVANLGRDDIRDTERLTEFLSV